VSDFLYAGTTAARSALPELTPAPKPVRRLASLTVYPRRICQHEQKRFTVPINGHVALSHPAVGPEQIHLSASNGGGVASTWLTIPNGEYGADFSAEVAAWASDQVVFYADTQDYSEEQSDEVLVSLYNDDESRAVACGEVNFEDQKAYDFEDDGIYPIPPKDAIVLASELMSAFIATVKSPQDSLPLDAYEAQQCFAFSELTALQTLLDSKSIGPQPPLEGGKLDPR